MAGRRGRRLPRTHPHHGLTGHATESDRPLLSQLADFAHLAGICAWIGGLVTLLFGVLSRRDPNELARVVPRYSKLAMVTMVFIVAGDTVLAVQTVGSVDRLFNSSYGQLLLIKLSLIALVLLIAQSSRGWIARRLDFAVVLRGDAVRRAVQRRRVLGTYSGLLGLVAGRGRRAPAGASGAGRSARVAHRDTVARPDARGDRRGGAVLVAARQSPAGVSAEGKMCT